MKFPSRQPALESELFSWLPQINSQVGIFAIARFLSEVGTGFTMFYAPIFFVNQVGLSATSVGIALASASILGIVGKIVGGSLADSPNWGRRRTLLLAAAISVIGSLVLAATNNFATLVIGRLICGLGMGFYWPASEAIVADASEVGNRRETFALTKVADHLGLAIGSALAGLWVATTGFYRGLFVIDAISFMVFLMIVYGAINETYQPQVDEYPKKQHFTSWMTALRDRRLLIYVAVNIIFTTYLSQINSTLPIYFKNFVNVGGDTPGFAATTISTLFSGYLALAIVCQFPIAAALKNYSHTLALTISAILWAIGFSLIWVTTITTSHHLLWVTLALAVFALAMTSYTPFAASLVTDLAPESQRGVYFSINALCWAMGNFMGSLLGGWALDQSRIIVNNYWLCFALSLFITVGILQYLNRILVRG
ncbi:MULTISPECIES: MFS transporter [unclassified Tolypothrix]|uniref:MFS transporter n=1 Tax=unclassified Tolypothrix TaxID=2649714 RepID=UPI0005EABA38|nr:MULTISPECIES: MFS transporter [unclassified Tolypothrix]BAY92446.1 major facilitator transporter [Microchaete diplosiphon NIES-3275]EKF05982.1 transporter, major facilitator family protein [Tolypothrix sp. PCC 7601]MBE9086964.1 MFS transporter [Tolypothrix sp. LEGE 11397]UYD26404.1 MFS transporter [Tolypothrix sp. PCC 7712]UYD31359.1 MFS transporter [Tolypothrix sp. PCC 7601]